MIFHDVSGPTDRCLVAAQRVLVAVSLPQTVIELRFVVVPRVLLPARNELQAVRVLRFPFREKVHVIGHVAVREKRDLLFGCSG